MESEPSSSEAGRMPALPEAERSVLPRRGMNPTERIYKNAHNDMFVGSSIYIVSI
jgi:hypothetical protein